MKAESQPTMSIPRMHRMTVGDVLDALKDAPPNAIIQFKDGGFLEAGVWAAWGEIEVVEGRFASIVKTVWE